jgi:anti-anti-sigma factor
MVPNNGHRHPGSMRSGSDNSRLLRLDLQEFAMMPRIHTPRTESISASSRGSLTTISQDTSRALVRVVGEWDLANADVLAALLDEHDRAGRRFVRLDVSAVTFLDCACLEVLVAAHRRRLAARGTLVLTGVPARLARLLRLAGLDDELLTTSVSDLDAHPQRSAARARKPVVRSILRPA